MSIWTEVKCYCIISKDSGFSFAKYISEYFDNAKISYTQESSNSRLIVNISFNFPDEGLSAAYRLNKFAKDIKLADKNAYVDIRGNIRFVA